MGGDRIKRVEHVGDATLYLGDCLDVLPSLAGVDLFLCDPPYCSGDSISGVAIPTSAKYSDSSTRDFLGDARPQRAHFAWTAEWARLSFAAAAPYSVALVFSDWRNLSNVRDAIEAAGWPCRGIVVWDKGVTGARPQKNWIRSSQAEFVSAHRIGAMPRDDGAPCLPGVFRLAALRAAAKSHPTEKPLPLLEELCALAPDGGTIADLFMGSGSSGVAAIRTGRKFVGVEIDEGFFEIALQRLRDEQAARAA